MTGFVYRKNFRCILWGLCADWQMRSCGVLLRDVPAGNKHKAAKISTTLSTLSLSSAKKTLLRSFQYKWKTSLGGNATTGLWDVWCTTCVAYSTLAASVVCIYWTDFQVFKNPSADQLGEKLPMLCNWWRQPMTALLKLTALSHTSWMPYSKFTSFPGQHAPTSRDPIRRQLSSQEQALLSFPADADFCGGCVRHPHCPSGHAFLAARLGNTSEICSA